MYPVRERDGSKCKPNGVRHPNEHSHANTNQYPHQYPNEYADQHAHEHTDRGADSHSDEYADQHSDKHTHCYSDTNSDSHADQYTDADRNTAGWSMAGCVCLEVMGAGVCGDEHRRGEVLGPKSLRCPGELLDSR